MTDFIGFSYGGVHSSELGIYRVSNGSRYTSALLPNFQDRTVSVPGGRGAYYFGTDYTQFNFTIDVAYDNLTEENIREIVETFSGDEIKPLIFDEAPYKQYMVKPGSPPQLAWICFDDEGDRIYKGEGTISLIGYFPYAKSTYKFLNQYIDANKGEWAEASGLQPLQGVYDQPGTTVSLYNGGQLETDIKVYLPFPTDGRLTPVLHIEKDGQVISILTLGTVVRKGSDTHLLVDSEVNLIKGVKKNGSTYEETGNLYNEYIKNGSFFQVPMGKSSLVVGGATSELVEYDYLYYY